MTSPAPFDFGSERDVALYDELPLWSALAGQLLLEHVPLGATDVLDLGCGTGFPLLELAERLGPRARAVGLDPWRAAVARACAKRRAWGVSHAQIAHGNGAAMPFRAACFDLVVSNLGVNNFDDVAGALRECHRVLRPAGVLALTSNLVGHMRELYEAFARVLAGDDAALERLRRHVAHRATVESLRARLGDAGFETVGVETREVALRYANADGLLEHHFIRLGFRPAWEEVAAGPASWERLRAELDRIARDAGELRLTVPLAYLAARRR